MPSRRRKPETAGKGIRQREAIEASPPVGNLAPLFLLAGVHFYPPGVSFGALAGGRRRHPEKILGRRQALHPRVLAWQAFDDALLLGPWENHLHADFPTP